ncbi:MAG: archease [Elusimicrobia bacterium]|nr:archease [Elusimicrobiota bacterium]
MNGASWAELYGNAAKGLRALAGLKAGQGGRAEDLALSFETAEDLLVAWLEELIYRLSVEGEVAAAVRFSEAGPTSLCAAVRWRALEPGERAAVEVRAATYDGLRVRRKNGLLTAAVNFDVYRIIPP